MFPQVLLHGPEDIQARIRGMTEHELYFHSYLHSGYSHFEVMRGYRSSEHRRQMLYHRVQVCRILSRILLESDTPDPETLLVGVLGVLLEAVESDGREIPELLFAPHTFGDVRSNIWSKMQAVPAHYDALKTLIIQLRGLHQFSASNAESVKQ